RSMRERLSRPNSVFANGCFHVGPSSRSINFLSAGSYGASHGANSAAIVSAATMKRPVAANLFFRRNSVIPDARVYDGVQDVGGQIYENVCQCNRQNAALRERIVSGEDCLDRQAAK